MPTDRAANTTADRTIVGAPPGRGGYRRLVPGPGLAHVHRTELAGPGSGPVEVLATIAQLSDLHVCDAQSPARVEFLDRWADPDSPVRHRLGEVGTYRAQELLSAQVADAMARAVRAIAAGPVGGAPVELAVVTGDCTDNAQANELDWYLTLLDGGTVRPDSGDLDRFEGVADEADDDERYWHPEPEKDDLPRARYGFPRVPGLLAAARRPFTAPGLGLPWLAVHGNHDRLLQGTVPGTGALGAAAVGRRKPVALPAGHWSDDAIVALLDGLAACDPAALAVLGAARWRAVTADPGRRIVSRAEFVAAHARPGAAPGGHGFTVPGRAHYRHDLGRITLLVLDTVNPHGGWQGSLDAAQFEWLAAELAAADGEQRPVLLAAHHPVQCLTNATAPDGAPRVLGDEVSALLTRHRCLLAWLDGHTHRAAVTAHRTWWQLTTPSLIDWPQQARLIEVLRRGRTITLATTLIDHAGRVPWRGGTGSTLELAGLSRELAANDWQWRDAPLERHPRAGAPGGRNVLAHLPDPFA